MEGLRYVRQTPTLRIALTIFTIIAMVCINFSVLLPLLASDTLNAGAEVYGLLTACFGAGALAGALISASIGRATWPVLLVGAAGFGLGELLLAPQRSVVGAVLLLLATGICYTIYTSTTNALVQLSAPPYLQGRVAGLYSYIFAGSSPFGALLAGSLAARGGTDLAFVVAGVVALGSALFGLLMWRRLRARPEAAEVVAKSA